MKVLMINGSPHKNGSTNAALGIVASELAKNEIETEVIQVGNLELKSCQGCRHCRMNNTGKCIIDDEVNAFLQKAARADGFVFGSPVHYAGITGALQSFLGRAFFAGNCFAYKPGAAVLVCRRAGALTAFDQINKFMAISQMPIVSTTYWNMVFGDNAAEIMEDKEGVQILRGIGRNMAWLLSCIEAGKKQGIDAPPPEPRERTSFIR